MESGLCLGPKLQCMNTENFLARLTRHLQLTKLWEEEASCVRKETTEKVEEECKRKLEEKLQELKGISDKFLVDRPLGHLIHAILKPNAQHTLPAEPIHEPDSGIACPKVRCGDAVPSRAILCLQ